MTIFPNGADLTRRCRIEEDVALRDAALAAEMTACQGRGSRIPSELPTILELAGGIRMKGCGWRSSMFFPRRRFRAHGLLRVICSLASCPVFPEAACHERIHRESVLAAGVIPWSTDTEVLRPRRRSLEHPTVQAPHRRGLPPLDSPLSSVSQQHSSARTGRVRRQPFLDASSAVGQNVAASTQNQALAAVLFVYEHVLSYVDQDRFYPGQPKQELDS